MGWSAGDVGVLAVTEDEERAADRLWLERSRSAQGLPMKVDDVDVVALVVRLVCGEEIDDEVSVSTRR